MLFHGLITKENEWHGLNGVIPTCHGTSLNFGLDIYLRMGRYMKSLIFIFVWNIFLALPFIKV